MDILAYGERNLARNLEENYKKLVGELCPIWRERERKVWKVFEKMVWTSQICLFKKTWFTTFDWSKINFDWSKQIEALFKILKQFRLIEKQIGSIEADRGFLKTF